MRTRMGQPIGKSGKAAVIRSLVVLCAALVMSLSTPSHALVLTLTGTLDGAGGLGGTGLEGGSFSGTLTTNPAAVDQEPATDFGVYDLASWNLSLFDSSSVLAGQFSSAHSGANGQMFITQDPVGTGQFGNIQVAFDESLDAFLGSGSFPGVLALFGVWFDSALVTTDALPSDFSDAAYTGDGLFGLLPSAAATFTATAFLTQPGVTVPEPATLLLLGFGLMGVAGIRKKRS